MTIRPTRLATQLGLAFGSLVLLHCGAFAQTLERVEITGSNIRRAQSETPVAVQTVTREEIDRSGKSSVAELLQTLALDSQGSVPTSFGSGFAPGASGISLRGLGAASTLVLINGRRTAPYGLADDGQKVFVDLNIIPLEAVERVDILKDGASAIYGSDAIAGVVNIILKRDYAGTAVKASYGTSRYGDGTEKRASITHGFGDVEKDGYNLLFNFEVSDRGAIWARDRAGRDQIGRSDLRDLGFDANGTTAGTGSGGTGAILANNLAGSSVNGNVRNPITLDYFSRGNTNTAATGFTRNFPGAACSNFTSHAQGDPGGGCLTDAIQDYTQIMPSAKSTNLFGRGTFNLGSGMQAYVDGIYYTNKSESTTTPSGVSASVGFPGGPVTNSGIALGADHPDNPYFGTAARVRYLAADVGPRVGTVDATTTRLVAGVKGTVADWDYDTALLFSENKLSNTRTGYLQRDVTFALLNPNGANNLVAGQTNAQVAAANNAAYAALPAGTFWRIAENANLNSAALYAALSPEISNDALSRMEQVDFKASRDLTNLEGGALSLALGGELRHEKLTLDPTTGTDRGNIIGLGYSAYAGSRTISAVYGELAAPVLKTLELTAAARFDKYSDSGNSFTPKVGAKWTPSKEFALRGTYGQGFRAPSAAENGQGGLAFFTTAADPLRCDPAGLNIASACAATVAGITSPNPALKPEKSKNYTLGTIWDPAPKTSIGIDYWEIHRTNEINQESTGAAIAAGHVVRDPTSSVKAGDPGPIVAVLVNYVNSAKTKVNGLDFDLRQGFDLGEGNGKFTLDWKWTHLIKWTRIEQDGTVLEFAGTHGNCDVTNCMGTPKDRWNLGATWENNGLKVSAVVNYRGPLSNKFTKADADCATTFADGSDAPAGCKIKSFKTVDLSARYAATKNLDVFGSIQNLFDAVAPLDPTTYGASSFNPLDISGAIGRYFTAGLRYKF